jgi:hypothetical protein
MTFDRAALSTASIQALDRRNHVARAVREV